MVAVAAAVARQAVGGARPRGFIEMSVLQLPSRRREGSGVAGDGGGPVARGWLFARRAGAALARAQASQTHAHARGAGRSGAHLAVVFLRHTTFPPLIA